MRVFLAPATVLLTVVSINATPIGSAPSPAKIASPQVAIKTNLTFEKYGPQSTARAVRASLKAALAPDPLSMGALLFCAFALRWMRMAERTDGASKGSRSSSASGGRLDQTTL
jgi:hypothetical protein